MVDQKGRDNEEVVTRHDGMTDADGSTARRAPETGVAGGSAGVETESVDFDAMGDLDRGANDDEDSEASTGPGPGYGMPANPSGSAGLSRRSGVGNAGSAVTTPRISSDDADTGGGIAGDDGIGQGDDMDLTTASVGAAPTGTPSRAGLGGTDSGDSMADDPAAGSGMANPANMGDQG